MSDDLGGLGEFRGRVDCRAIIAFLFFAPAMRKNRKLKKMPAAGQREMRKMKAGRTCGGWKMAGAPTRVRCENPWCPELAKVETRRDELNSHEFRYFRTESGRPGGRLAGSNQYDAEIREFWSP